MFDDMTSDMETSKGPTVTELLFRARKLNILLFLISQSDFKVPKTIILNATHHFITKTHSKKYI